MHIILVHMLPYGVGHSFVELVPYLFNLPDVKVFLSQRICQDPLECFFGMQRQRGSVNDNPNVQEFLKNTQAIRIRIYKISHVFQSCTKCASLDLVLCACM